MVCIDNSDFTRNGDYTPTRFEAQTDAVNLVCGAKTQQNPENSVGLLTSAGDRIEVRITPTTDLGKMVSELAKIQNGGTSDLLRAIQTAQLALKHRQNKNQKQRIVAFVGSPVNNSDKELETLGKNLKKNNVSLDIVSFGEVDENNGKLEKLLNVVNSNDTSHLVEIPIGPKLLSDVLLSSVIISPDGEGGGAAGGYQPDEFGINPNDDPELALALRISMEEERARQQAADGGGAPAEGAPAPAPAPVAEAADGATPAPAPSAMPVASDAAVMEAIDMEDMDEELRQALLLSMQETGPTAMEQDAPPGPAAEAPKQAEPAPGPSTQDAPMADAATTAPAGAAAPAAPAAAAGGADDASGAVDSKWFQDPSFVQELLGSLPGVDISDPRIQAALQEVGSDDKEKKDGEKKDDDKSDGANGSGGSSGAK